MYQVYQVETGFLRLGLGLLILGLGLFYLYTYYAPGQLTGRTHISPAETRPDVPGCPGCPGAGWIHFPDTS